jgi:Tol biopolymer transport system component
MAFSPDGKRLATSSSYDGSVRMWDVAGGKELWNQPWSLQNAWKQPLAFSPDGKWLVAAPLSQKQGLVLLDAEDGKLRAEITRNFKPNSDPAFSRDGKSLAVVQRNPGQVVVYEVEKLLALP